MTRHLATGFAALATVCAASCTSATQPVAQAGANPTCIEASRIQAQEVVSNDEIRFTLAGGDVWSNRLTRSCPGLKAQGGFSWDVSTRICPGLQTIYLLESGIPCQLGDFTRISSGDTQG